MITGMFLTHGVWLYTLTTLLEDCSNVTNVHVQDDTQGFNLINQLDIID